MKGECRPQYLRGFRFSKWRRTALAGHLICQGPLYKSTQLWVSDLCKVTAEDRTCHFVVTGGVEQRGVGIDTEGALIEFGNSRRHRLFARSLHLTCQQGLAQDAPNARHHFRRWRVQRQHRPGHKIALHLAIEFADKLLIRSWLAWPDVLNRLGKLPAQG